MSLVSVIVPMYNAEPYISATLASILQERDIPLEVVVVNDGSTDASLDRVRAIDDERVRVINGPCQGFVAATNVGMAAARGEIIMRCDADDLYPPQRLVRQVNWLTQHPEFGAVSGNFSTIDVKGHLIANLKCGEDAEEITEELCNGITRNHFCTFAMRAEVWRALGGSRPALNGAADLDLQLRMGELCRVWFLPDVEYYYRLHDSSLTHTQRTVEREFFDSLVVEFQRQRRTQGSDDLQRGCPPPTPPQGDSNSVMKTAEHTQGLLIGSAWQEHQAGHKQRSLAIGMHSVIVRPRNMVAWRSLLALVVKPAGKGQFHDSGVKTPD